MAIEVVRSWLRAVDLDVKDNQKLPPEKPTLDEVAGWLKEIFDAITALEAHIAR